ncbi:MAG: RNA polymerase sigma factor SigM [Gemmatimonadota bacterium]
MLPPDAELLRRHVAGDPDAFGALFLRHRDRLWAVALRTLGDPDEAADALQDAMISAFRRASGFRGDSAVTTWLHRIVVNACLDRLRRRAARPVAGGLDEQALDLLAREPQVPDHGGDTDTALEVTAALRTLPAEQRAALVLVDMLGYPVADAAAVLGVSTGTIKSRCARGRARLVPRLAHLHGGPRVAGPGAPLPAPVPAGTIPPDGAGPAAGATLNTGAGPAADSADPGERNPAPPGCVSPAEGGGESRP